MHRFLLLFLVALLVFGVEGRAQEAKPQTKIGVSLALTGPLSVVGVTLRNAIELAQKHHDVEGSVRFIFEDDAFLPKNTVGIVNKFITQDKVDALVTFGASTSLSVAAIAEQAKVPMAGMTVLETLEQGRQYVVRFFVSTADMNTSTVARVKQLGIKDMAVVATVQDATLKQKEHFIQAKPSKIVLDQEFLPGDLDFKTTAARIRALDPQAVYVIMLPPQGSNFVKQLRRAGYTGSIVGSLQLGAPAEIANAEGMLAGAWIATGDDSAAHEFYAAYAQAYPKEKAFSETVYGYDLATMLIRAAKHGDINQYLHTVRDFQGALGKYSADGSGSFRFPVTIKEITAQGSRYLAD